MNTLFSVHRDNDGRIDLVGIIDRIERTFRYNSTYLSLSNASPLSFSLPLQAEKFMENEFRPYFEGLLPEGSARQALAAQLKVRESDYLSILTDSGLDCVGDVVVNLDAYSSIPSYEPLTLNDVTTILSRPVSLAEASIASRLSLAGTQGKVGLFHDNSLSLNEGWSLPRGGAASTHILKTESLNNLSIIEYLSMTCAHQCGVNTAPTTILNFGTPVICSERFDREVISIAQKNGIRRLHQEDFTQVFGLLPGSKYAEIEPSSVAAVAGFLQQKAPQPLDAVQDFALITCFNYLIGNCDNHLKNLSILHSQNGKFATLSPAYDLVCTTVFNRFSRVMGMRLGSASTIDEVTPDSFVELAHDLGITPSALQLLCSNLLKKAVPALNKSAIGIEETFPLAPYLADDIEEDISSRLQVLEIFCNRQI